MLSNCRSELAPPHRGIKAAKSPSNWVFTSILSRLRVRTADCRHSSDVCCGRLQPDDLGALFCCNVYVSSLLFIYLFEIGWRASALSTGGSPSPSPRASNFVSGSPCSRSLHVAPERTGPNPPPNQSVPQGRAQRWEEPQHKPVNPLLLPRMCNMPVCSACRIVRMKGDASQGSSCRLG